MPARPPAFQPPTFTGTSISGPAITFTNRVVVPINIQVDPFGTATQSATNTATVNQDVLAVSGSASGTNGGVAVSGPAVAGAIAVVTQINVQINLCRYYEVVQTAL